jgi:hypothetical protein
MRTPSPGHAPRRGRARWQGSTLASALLAVGVLAGCGDLVSSAGPGTPGSDASVDELAAHAGAVCPDELPAATDASFGFGTSTPAESAPALPTPELAWICRYNPTEAGPAPGGGTTWGWVRDGDARPVDSARLTGLEGHLAALTPAEDKRACSADLGPRWMMVYSHGRDLTGVVVDDFGCRDVRLTDEPFRTVPGDAGQPGTVPGVLAGPAGLLDELKGLLGR